MISEKRLRNISVSRDRYELACVHVAMRFHVVRRGRRRFPQQTSSQARLPFVGFIFCFGYEVAQSPCCCQSLCVRMWSRAPRMWSRAPRSTHVQSKLPQHRGSEHNGSPSALSLAASPPSLAVRPAGAANHSCAISSWCSKGGALGPRPTATGPANGLNPPHHTHNYVNNNQTTPCPASNNAAVRDPAQLSRSSQHTQASDSLKCMGPTLRCATLKLFL